MKKIEAEQLINVLMPERWRLETKEWSVIEYEQEPHRLSVKVENKVSGFSFFANGLGVSHRKLEKTQAHVLEKILYEVAVTALDEGWKLSPNSLMENIRLCVPAQEDFGANANKAPKPNYWVKKAWAFLAEED